MKFFTHIVETTFINMDVSENKGTPKSSTLIGFSIIFTIHFGGPTPIFATHPYQRSWSLRDPATWRSSIAILPFAAMVHHTLHIARVMALPATRFVILQGPNNCGKRTDSAQSMGDVDRVFWSSNFKVTWNSGSTKNQMVLERCVYLLYLLGSPFWVDHDG